MGEYAPTDDEVRERWMEFDGGPDPGDAEEFDRWLREHDAKVLRDAADDHYWAQFGNIHGRVWLRDRADALVEGQEACRG